MTYYDLTEEQKKYAKKYGYYIMLESYFSETPNKFKLARHLYEGEVAHLSFIKETKTNLTYGKIR